MIRIYRTQTAILLEKEEKVFISKSSNWDEYINRDDLYHLLSQEISTLRSENKSGWLKTQLPLLPVGSQEIWAAGVTYLRSKVARMEESQESGGATFYDKVYDAERPELFYKGSAHRAVGTNDLVRIRKDSTWNVPEPELTLFITSSGKIAGYTIGNDMSSRSIEGENPLYLPQAKVYDGSASIGPCILVTEEPLPPATEIRIRIQREGQVIYEGNTPISQMKRKHEELVDFLFRECSFPFGCFLMTGTCLVPGNDFTLQSKDVISISIDHIGELVNIVA